MRASAQPVNLALRRINAVAQPPVKVSVQALVAARVSRSKA
jgi:hypothetical protein